MSETKPPRISSSYAIIDIDKGRKKLAAHLAKHGGLPVVIHAILADPFGSDDGVSIEFNAEVLKIEVDPALRAPGGDRGDV